MHPSIEPLFHEWRALEAPPRLAHGEPDYGRAALARQQAALQQWQARLAQIDRRGWSIADQVDLHLIGAETHALAFNLQVLQPWARDPAFYKSLWTQQSDTPDHEGPTHHGAIELWQYRFPLSAAAAAQLAQALGGIAPLLEQARVNLTGDAGDLWRAGIATLQQQAHDLERLAESAGAQYHALAAAIDTARSATARFVDWLVQQAPGKTAPSGIGRAHYDRYLREVQLLPLDWQDEVALLKRELARAHASLALEEHRNRHLPPLRAIASQQEYATRTDASVRKYMDFLHQQQILAVRNDMEPALRAHTGEFVEESQRNFFAIARHFEPMALWCHWYHWFEVARAAHQPHPRIVRRGALRHNIFAYRSEGLATAMEEMMMHAGLFDDNPRSREVVWIMLAQRAARGLAGLYAQANLMTLQQAQEFHVANTPRGWMRADLPLLAFEQHLYLRQPGYGSSYVTGKYQIEQLLADFAQQQGSSMRLADFFAAVDAAGVIPVSLLRWELAGRDEDLHALGLARA